MRISLTCLLGLVLLTGCYSVQEHRARQFSTDYAALTDAQQARLQTATIAQGDSAKMVYIALGTPNFVRQRADGKTEWIHSGVVLEEAPLAEPPTLQFASRSELRLPQKGEARFELRIRFSGQTVTDWTLTPMELSADGGQKRLPMGSYPSIP